MKTENNKKKNEKSIFFKNCSYSFVKAEDLQLCSID